MAGSLHPLTIFLRQAISVFEEMGFEVVEGPEIETEWYNFDSLRVPEWHPARDVQDTFYLGDGRLLRTHTSAMQVRAMEKRKPPVRIVVPGRVFRNEATDASHEANFYQLEGFAIDRSITMAHLKGTLVKFVQEIFGEKIEYKFVPEHYPFVEPGMDMAIKVKGKWMEVLGSGMIHPEVLKNMGVNPEKFQGFAFGMGVDRLAMILAGFSDVRLSYRGDLRFLKQFKFSLCK
ncbi:phenylalanine--tRNA ligase subunit alpha [bacterium]|nr:phenylalanine--tRNA ligase subunit alpha [bacterium]